MTETGYTLRAWPRKWLRPNPGAPKAFGADEEVVVAEGGNQKRELETMQNFLRKLIQPLGKSVEKVGGWVEKRRSKKLSTPTAQEGMKLPPEYTLHALMQYLEEREIRSLIPNLAGKKTLCASWGENTLCNLLREKKASPLLMMAPQAEELGEISETTSEQFGLVGSLKAAPFKNDFFDCSIISAWNGKNDLSTWVGELTRISRDGSRMVLVFTHPYLQYLSKTVRKIPQGLSQNFMTLRRAGIYVEEIKEAFVDESAKEALSNIPSTSIENLKGLPLLVLFKAIRLKRK